MAAVSSARSANNLQYGHKRDEARVCLAQALMDTGNDDREAFRLLYALTCNKLFGVCLRICSDRSAAEDVLAEVYLIVWKRAGAWDPALGSAISWLATIARNRAIDWRRARTAWQFEAIGDGRDLVDGSPDAETILLSAEQGTLVHRCLAALAPDQQAAIRAVYLEGLQYSELATREGAPLGTVKSRVRRGLAKMKTDLSGEGRSHPKPCRPINSSSSHKNTKLVVQMECSA